MPSSHHIVTVLLAVALGKPRGPVRRRDIFKSSITAGALMLPLLALPNTVRAMPIGTVSK